MLGAEPGVGHDGAEVNSWLLIALAATVVLGTLGYFAFRSPPRDAAPDHGSAERLGARLAEGRDYKIFVGVPLETPERWRPATRGDNGELLIDDVEIDVDDVRAFVVAYPGGELLDHLGPPHELPDGVTAMATSDEVSDEQLRDADLEAGRSIVVIEYGPSAARPRDWNHFSTKVTNISTERIRVLDFGGYTRAGPGTWKLNTVSGDRYSAAQFRAWYAQQGEWLGPGESATDPNNYGGRPALWAYFCETESGKKIRRWCSDRIGVTPPTCAASCRWRVRSLRSVAKTI